ncbi:MAG TPA: ATP-binding protein [Nannocystaceae bacterium]|nr:ATP-binding protein [Nannocystaceae bacterium]
MTDPDDEDELLRSVALQNAHTIMAARQRAEQELRATKEALEEETRILEVLNRTGALLASKLDLENVVQTVTDAGTDLSGAQFGAFFYNARNEDGDVYTLYTLSGAPREAFVRFPHPRSTPLFAPTFNGEGVVRIADVRADPRYGQWSPYNGMPPGHLPVASYLAVPVASRSGGVIGGLFFGHESPNVFQERHERIIVGLAAQAAIAIDNARLFEDARQSAEAERAARAEVERISLMKDEFLATLSHELRTPLNAVLGWSEMLLARAGPESDSRRGLETIARNARAQVQMIEDLLDMNRIVSGKIRLDVQQTDLAGVVEAAVDSIRPSAEAKSIRLRTILDPFVGLVYGDPNRLQQVVWNLLSNAVKFTPKSGKIDVILGRVNSHTEITVIDSGIGIEPAFLPHVFERFRQADASTTRKYSGLGLGLSIVKQLVDLHGGNVRVESGGEGRGTTFVVSLPLRVVRETGDRTHPTSLSATTPEVKVDLSGLVVLVVDDENDAREMVKCVLVDARAEVLTAASADEALAIVRSRRPAIVVSDVGMPDKDGYEFIRELRALPAADGGKTPAVALTAFARSEDRTRALLAGYHVHVAKPIEPAELVVTIASLAGRTGNG